MLNKTIPDAKIFAAHFDKFRQVKTEFRIGNIDLFSKGRLQLESFGV